MPKPEPVLSRARHWCRQRRAEGISPRATWLGWLAAAKSPVGIAVIGYLILVTAVTLYIDAYGDVSGLGMLLFGPRWWFMLPWALLVPTTLLAPRKRMVFVALVGVLVTLFGVMEFDVPSPFREHASRRALRLVTYNTDRSAELALRIRDDLARWRADIVVMQDCKTIVADSLRAIDGVRVHVTPEFCMVSRVPVESVELMPSTVRQGVGKSAGSAT